MLLLNYFSILKELALMTTPEISERGKIAPPSPIRKLTPLAVAAENQGKHVYKLNIGQPDIESPPSFFEGLRRFSDKVVAYAPSQGNLPLRKAWANYYNARLAFNINEEDLIITLGASEALSFTFSACCNPGDEILVLDPSYGNYFGFAAISGVTLRGIATHIEDNFALPSYEQLLSAITPKTKALLMCNPNNPTGAVYGSEELELLLKVCNEKNIFLIADETYREMVFDKRSPLSFWHIEPGSERLIIIDSLSKQFSLCGARIGCILTKNEDLKTCVLKFAQARLSIPTVEQCAATYMLENLEEDYFPSVKQEYEKRRLTLYNALQAIPDIKSYLPGGAFYFVVGLPVDDAEHFATFMLSEFEYQSKTVFVAPVEGFYVEEGRGRNEARLACVLNSEDTAKAVEILKTALDTYRERQ